MKVFSGITVLLGFLCGIVACSSTSTKASSSATANPDLADSGTPDVSVDPDDPANQPPHALGTITLGEIHAAGSGGTPSPIVGVSFVLDALKARACSRKLDAACEVVDVPRSASLQRSVKRKTRTGRRLARSRDAVVRIDFVPGLHR